MQKSVNGFYVYAYHDKFRYPVLQGPLGQEAEKEQNTPEFRKRLSEALALCGWEGDGQLEAMMFPPWLGTLTGWFPIFHVKQSNNGTSWIASERRLTLEELDWELPLSLYQDNKAKR